MRNTPFADQLRTQEELIKQSQSKEEFEQIKKTLEGILNEINTHITSRIEYNVGIDDLDQLIHRTRSLIAQIDAKINNFPKTKKWFQNLPFFRNRKEIQYV